MPRAKLLAMVALVLGLGLEPALGQQTVKQCVPTAGNTGVPGCQDVSGSNPLPTSQTGAIPAGSNTIGNVGVNAGSNSIGTVGLNAGTNAIGSATSTLSGAVTNPTSTLTRPADTNAYSQNDLIASSVTAGSVTVPSFAIANAAGGAAIARLRLVTNKTSGWDGTTFTVRLWTAAPTYTNGDNGAYAVATGAAGQLGSFSITLSQQGDGAVGQAAPAVGTAVWAKLASGTSVFWDLQYTGSASLTPASAQTFTLAAEVVN